MKANICPVCGTENSVDAKFCKNDGARLTDGSSQAGDSEASGVSSSAVPKSSTLTSRMRYSIAALFILIGGGIAGYFYFANPLIDPVELNTSISSNLAAKGLVGLSVEVSKDRIATLSGEVENDQAVNAALEIAGMTKGVKGVLSQLTILPPIAEVEALLSQALRDQQLNDIVVSIDPQRVVTLAGSVSDEAMINIAMNTAAATPGLKGLTSQIQVIAPAEIVSNNEPGPSIAAQGSPGSWSGQQGRGDSMIGNAADSNPYIGSATGSQDVRIINNPRNPVADRRWLRN